MNDILNPHACEKSSRHPEQGLRTISDLFVGQAYLLQIAWCTPCLAVLWTAEAVVHSVQMMRVDLPVCVGGQGQRLARVSAAVVACALQHISRHR